MLSIENQAVNRNAQVLNIADHCHNQLVALVGDIVTAHRDDLLVHDLNAIRRLKQRTFINVSYRSGTHLYEIPQPIVDNSRIDYIFGRKRPSNIYRDQLDMLCNYFGREDFFGYSHTFAYCDGKKVEIVSQAEAVAFYRKALKAVLSTLRLSKEIPGRLA